MGVDIQHLLGQEARQVLLVKPAIYIFKLD
jgi:hypothetical protein